MMFLEITYQTWLVTGLGFGIVLLLLFCFVYVMKGLGLLMGMGEKKKQQAVPAQPAPTKAEEQPGSADEMAAVAYALHLYYNSLHDEDNPRMTVKNHTTAWHIIQ